VRLRVENTSPKDPGWINVDFYASADPSITTSDTYLGQAGAWLLRDLGSPVTLRSVFPTSVPPGSYYIGWVIDPDNRMVEDDEANNTGYQSTLRLKVVSPSPSVLYVDARAQGTGVGSDWSNAFTSLQDALAVAVPGSEIRVAKGVYRPDQGIGLIPGDRGARFAVPGGITIRGGYAGIGAPDPDARNIQAYPTVLSGDLKADDRAVADPGKGETGTTNVVRIPDPSQEASRLDNSRHVLAVVGPDPTTLDGVRVSGGYADGPVATLSGISSGIPAGIPQTEAQGAGLLMMGGSLTLVNCTFTDNWASGDGGAIYAADGHLELTDCTFRANGAGLENPTGQSHGTGGAIRNNGKSQMVLARCRFYDNFAGSQGGALDTDEGSVTLTRCLLLQNRAAGAGGGALWNSKGRVSLVSCTLSGNRTNGGGGAIVNAWSGVLNAANCSLHANYGRVQAGAIHNFAGGRATLWNCTLAANGQSGLSGAIGCWPSYDQAGSELTIVNSILWNGGDELSTENQSIVMITHTNIQGGWPGVGNFTDNPLFLAPAGPDGIVGTEDDDLRLGSDSPCLDRGDSALLPRDFADLDNDGNLQEPLPLDLEGRERITGPGVDLGAYEMQPASSSSSTSSPSCSTD
jgi:predicted outer membrane repeat protein